MYWLIPTQILTYYMKSDLKIRLWTCFTLGVRARWGGLWNWELFFHPTVTCQHKSWSSTSQDFFFLFDFPSLEFYRQQIHSYAVPLCSYFFLCLSLRIYVQVKVYHFFHCSDFLFSGISFCSFIRCRDWGALSHIWHPGNLACKDAPPTTITSPWAQWYIVS